MKKARRNPGATRLLLAVSLALTGCGDASTTMERAQAASASADLPAAALQTFSVSGSAMHDPTNIVHSEEPIATGKVQRSTDIIKLTGDLEGYVLYHVTSTFDNATNTLVNTGTQFFSGTIGGSDPVVLHDDRFRFEVDLATGAATGEVFLGRSNDAPNESGWYECHLTVATGQEGDSLPEYSGDCTQYGQVK